MQRWFNKGNLIAYNKAIRYGEIKLITNNEVKRFRRWKIKTANKIKTN